MIDAVRDPDGSDPQRSVEFEEPTSMSVDKVETGASSPVTEQSLHRLNRMPKRQPRMTG